MTEPAAETDCSAIFCAGIGGEQETRSAIAIGLLRYTTSGQKILAKDIVLNSSANFHKDGFMHTLAFTENFHAIVT